MSQASKIYKFLENVRYPAADQVLLTAMRRAEEPYRTSALESILEAQRPAGTTELVKQFNEYPDIWKEMMIQRANHLHHGLRQSGSEADTQTKLNTLDIIKKSHYSRLADVAGILLRDKNNVVAKSAGDVFIEFGNLNANLKINSNDDLVKQSIPGGKESQGRSSWILISAIDSALQNYKLHRRRESIYAAMCIVSAHVDHFWKNMLQPFHPVGKSVREILQKINRPQLARFTITALASNDLRSAAFHSINRQKDLPTLGMLAQEYLNHKKREQVVYGMTLIKTPVWMNPLEVAPEKMDKPSQLAMPEFVLATGAPEEKKALYFSAICEKSVEQAGLAALSLIKEFSPEQRDIILKHSVESNNEAVAMKALDIILEKKNSQVRKFIAKLIKSPHPRVRARIRTELKDYIFSTYWRNFDSLNDDKRLAAGKTIFKVDENLAHQFWVQHANLPQSSDRLQAIRMACMLNRVDQCLDQIFQMTTDKDEYVRSAAVMALGRAHNKKSNMVLQRLLVALKDRNPRVKANAIEAIGNIGEEIVAPVLAQYIQSPENRVRANAIKALMNFDKELASKAMQKMIKDHRPNHRRSGLWVYKQTKSSLKIPNILKKAQETTHVSV